MSVAIWIQVGDSPKATARLEIADEIIVENGQEIQRQYLTKPEIIGSHEWIEWALERITTLRKVAK